jgi:tetratricopeptide (TPR) repeat protein
VSASSVLPYASSPPNTVFARRVGIPLVLAVVTVLLFAPTFSYDFVNYDDPLFVTENAHVNRGLTADGVRWAFAIHGPSQYHPLTWLSHMLDVQLFGTRPGAHHAVNVALHTISTLLLYGALLTMTGMPWRSAAVAALFAWHPTRVESVAWIAERKDVLCALFVFATVWAYARYASRPSWWWYAVVLIAYALALMSKPMAITLPVLLLLLDYWPLERWGGRIAARIAEKLPLLVIALVSAWLSFLCQMEAKTVASVESFSLAQRLGNAVVSCVRYLRMTVLPTNLAVFYPRQPWASWQVAGAAAILIAITAAVIYARKRYALVGWLWFCVTLLPVIGVLQVGDQAMADRYTYLPLVGIFILVVWAISDVTERAAQVRRWIVRVAPIVLVAYGLATALQVTHWRDGATLFAHAIDVTRDNYLAHYNLGVVLTQRGQLADAAAQYDRALRIKPGYLEAHVNLGAVLEVLGDRAGAERHYRAALDIDPNDPDAKANLEALLAGGSRGGSPGAPTAPSAPPAPSR